MRDLFKTLARLIATVAVVPQLLSYFLRASLMGRDRALEGSTQALSLVPGVIGQYLRRAFLARVLAGGCAPSATVEFGTLFSQAGSRIDAHAYVGPRCQLGLVHLEANVLLGAGVHVPSGAHTHGTDASAPINAQDGARRMVRIGAGSWIGSNAVVMADIGENTVVGAGAVVTHALPAHAVAVGVPARVVRMRERAPEGDGL